MVYGKVKTTTKIILSLLLLVSVANASDRLTPHEMVLHYEREIQEREIRNYAKFEDLKHRIVEQQLLDELWEQKRQYEIDRIIDESNAGQNEKN